MKKFFKDKENLIILSLSLLIVATISIGKVMAYLYSASNVTYSKSGLSATNVQDAIEEIYNKACPNNAYCYWKKDWSHVALGDYVVMTPNPGTLDSQDRYAIDGSKTGYDSTTQYIYPKQLKLWRVIKKNSDGTVEMVSEYVSNGGGVFLRTAGYANYVGYLNELADQYKNPTYTIKTRYMGYYQTSNKNDGQTEYITDTTYFDDNGTEAGTEWTSSTPTSLKTKADNESLGGGDTLYAYDTELVQNALGTLKALRCNNNACSNPESFGHYRLASRNYYYNSPTNFGFRGLCIDSDGNLSTRNIHTYNNSWSTVITCTDLRPILTLKSGLSPSDALGTKDDPFVFE